MQYYKYEEDYLGNIIQGGKYEEVNTLYLRFITGSRHVINIEIEKHENFVILQKHSAFASSLTKLIDKEEFIEDIKKMVGVMAWVSVAKENFLYPLGQLLHEHIQKYGRILVNDMETYISEFIIVINAFAESESGEALNDNGTANLLIECDKFVSQEFGYYLA